MSEPTDLQIFKLDLPVRVEIKWEDDEDPDLSFYGAYTDTFKEGCIDRKKGGDMTNDREYRYWMPGPNHYPHNPKSWSHVRGKRRAKVIKQYGSLAKADAAYVLDDYRRCESFNRGDWNMVGCRVTVSFGHLEAKDSLWGINSDCSAGYRKEVETDCTANAIAELKTKILKRLQVE